MLSLCLTLRNNANWGLSAFRDNLLRLNQLSYVLMNLLCIRDLIINCFQRLISKWVFWFPRKYFGSLWNLFFAFACNAKTIGITCIVFFLALFLVGVSKTDRQDFLPMFPRSLRRKPVTRIRLISLHTGKSKHSVYCEIMWTWHTICFRDKQ